MYDSTVVVNVSFAVFKGHFLNLTFHVGNETCEFALTENYIVYPLHSNFIISAMVCNYKCVYLCYCYSFHLTSGFQPGQFPEGFSGFQGNSYHRYADSNCWNIDLSADLAEIIHCLVRPKSQHCTDVKFHIVHNGVGLCDTVQQE